MTTLYDSICEFIRSAEEVQGHAREGQREVEELQASLSEELEDLNQDFRTDEARALSDGWGS